MKRILILGAGGMAGHMVAYKLISNGYSVVCAARRPLPEPLASNFMHFDAEEEESLVKLISETTPDLIINCIGVLVKESEFDPVRAIKINSLLPRQLSLLGRDCGFKTIHISTDCVFSGIKGNYCEQDFRDGDDVYARSKALGELNDSRNLTIRTSIIGPELKDSGSGLFDWFMRQDLTVNGYTNHIWSGVTTLELANCIYYLLNSSLTGLINLTNGTGITKYELLKKINLIWREGKVNVDPFETEASINKKLVSTRLDFHFKVPTYDKMLIDMKDYMANSPFKYKYFSCG